MPRITKIETVGERVQIYLDGEYAQSIRARTFAAMELSVGLEISKEELRRREAFHWKIVYGPKSWVAEKVRIDRICQMLKAEDGRIDVSVTGFGADSVEMIDQHPVESGKPDLTVTIKGEESPVMTIEVTGSEQQRGSDYWVRPDKLAYAQRHPAEDVWIVLHYAKPRESVVAIKPDPIKVYVPRKIIIRQSSERYVVFCPSDAEVHGFAALVRHLRHKVDVLAGP